MEGIDAYAFHQELNHQTSMNNPKSRILETISSWLDLDLPNTPSFPQELQDLQMLDEHFFQFTTTTTHHHNIDYSEPLPNLPRPDSPFILDLHEFDINPPPPPLPPNHSTEKTTTTTTTATPECYQPTLPDHDDDDDDDECETYLNVMAESPECIGGVDQLFQSDHDHIHENFNIMSNSSSTTTDQVVDKNKKQKQKQQSSDHTTVDQDQDDDDEDQEDQEIEDEPKSRGTLNCKNLVSERNRRKRLSQQLLALRALVPNITKMDKRSVLVDALSYLKSMQEETARIQKELKENQQSKQQQQHHQPPAGSFMSETCLIHDDSPGSNRIPRILANTSASKPKPQIIEIDIEKIEDKRFIVKITCKGANNVGGEVLRVIESLGFEITYAALDQIKPQHILTTIFIRVKKQEKMTEEKLKDCIISSALRSGLTLQSC